MKARLPGGPKQSATHCHRPLKLTPCADAAEASKVDNRAMAVKAVFIAFLSSTIVVRRSGAFLTGGGFCHCGIEALRPQSRPQPKNRTMAPLQPFKVGQ